MACSPGAAVLLPTGRCGALPWLPAPRSAAPTAIAGAQQLPAPVSHAPSLPHTPAPPHDLRPLQLVRRTQLAGDLLLGFYVLPSTWEQPLDMLLNPIGHEIRCVRAAARSSMLLNAIGRGSRCWPSCPGLMHSAVPVTALRPAHAAAAPWLAMPLATCVGGPLLSHPASRLQGHPHAAHTTRCRRPAAVLAGPSPAAGTTAVAA